MFSRQQVGTLPKRVSTTKISTATWSRQSFNLFAQEQEAAAPAPQAAAPVEGENQHEQPQQQQQHRSGDNNIFAKPSTRVHAAPGGRSSVASLLAYTEEPAAPRAAPGPRRPSTAVSAILAQEEQEQPRERASSRVLAVPGGSSSMTKIIGGAAPSPPAAPRPAAQAAAKKSNIFSAPSPVTDRSTTRRIAVPGGSSEMDKVIAHQCPPDAAHGIRTGRTNESAHVVNLTPVPVRPHTSRTARINQESAEVQAQAAAPQYGQARFAARQKALASNIFSFGADMEEAAQEAAPQPQQQGAGSAPGAAVAAADSATLHGTGKPSTQVHHAPGGKSSGALW